MVVTAAGDAHRALLHPERDDVGHGGDRSCAALGDQQARRATRREADRVEEAVVADERDRAGDAQEQAADM
jgi:hypothetical protein